MSMTAEALEVMSDNYDIRFQGIKKQIMTEDFAHIPCYYFKRFLADKKSGRDRFPTIFRE